MAALSTIMSVISIVMSVASVIYQLVQSKKKTPAQNNEAAEARKGFETVVEGQPEHLALVYGRAKVGGIRVYHNTSSDFNFVTSNADKSFGESLVPAVVQSGSYTMLETNSITGESAIVSHNYAYGTSTMLDRSYTNGSRNEFLYFQQALCIGPINDVIDVIIDESRYLDDPALGTYGSVPAGTSYTADEDPSKTKWNDPSKPRSAMRIDAHYTEVGLNKSDAIISQNFPDRSNATFTGMAYISAVVRIDRDDPQFSGVPNLQFLVEGKLIRKVTNGILNTVWEYSNNPVWCLLDYLLDTTSGGSVDVTELDLPTFEASAPVAETVVQSNVMVGGKIWKSTDGKKNVSTRNLPLYECNIMIDTKKPVRDNVEAILATMGDARLVWSGGKYKLSLQYPGQSNSNIILAAALTEDNLMMDQDIEMAWPTASERLNHCIVRFNNETENFKEDSVSWPPKYSGTSLVGVGGTRYPLADYSYDEEKVGGRFLNNYGVWSTATNSATLTYNIIIRKVDIGDMVLEYTADDSMTIKIYNDSNTELYTYSKSDWTTLGSQTVTLGNATADKIYKIVITGSNSGGDKAVGAKLTKGSKIIWTTRETAYSSVITVIKDNTVYQTMLLEDSNTPLEMEQFFEGATDRYHALAKAEEFVRTSRTAYSIKFKYIINEKYLEPGDFITLTSDTLGIYNEYFRINSVKITEENSCEVQAQMFDHTHLAWYQKDDEYQKPNNIYSMSIPAPAWIVYEPSNNALTNSSGTLTWAPVSFSEFAGYVLYMYEAGSPRTSGNLPIFNEIGRAVDTSFVLPKLSTPSAFFAVKTISRSGKLSNFTYSSTEEAEFFIDTVYKFEGLVLTPNNPSSNKIAWNAFNVYKDGTFLKTIAAGDTSWTTGVLYLYFDIKSTDANQYTVRSTTLLTDLKNNKILGTYSGGIAYAMQNSELFPPTNLHLEGRDAPDASDGVLTIPFNTKDIAFSWSNALPNKAKSVTLDKYVLQFYTHDTNILKATEVIIPDNKLDGQYSMSFEKNTSIFGTATRKFKIKLFALDSAGYLSSTSLDATFDNAKPSAVTLDFTPVFNAAYLKVPVVSDIDVLKYVFKQYDSTGTVLQKTVETTSSFIDFEATAGTAFKYTVTLYDAFGAGDESSSVAITSTSVDADTYTYTGLQFTPDIVTNKVSWSAFQYSKNGSTLVPVAAGEMVSAWATGVVYLYLNTLTNTLLSTTSLNTAVTGRILATYKGGTDLTTDAGKAFISGDQLLAGTVGANQLSSDTLITNKAQIGNVLESSNYVSQNNTYAGWKIDKEGHAEFSDITIRKTDGTILMASNAGIEWGSISGDNKPEDNATNGATFGTPSWSPLVYTFPSVTNLTVTNNANIKKTASDRSLDSIVVNVSSANGQSISFKKTLVSRAVTDAFSNRVNVTNTDGNFSKSSTTAAWDSFAISDAGYATEAEIEFTKSTTTIGLPVTFVSNVLINGTTLTKESPTSAYDSQVCSAESYAGGCTVRFKAGQTIKQILIGINSDPLTDASYTSLDYAFYLNANGYWYTYESNVNTMTGTTYSVSDIFEIVYSGTTVVWKINGVVKRTVTTTANRTFYLDSSFYEKGASVNSVEFLNSVGQSPTLTLRSNVYLDGNQLKKAFSNNSWDSHAYSAESYQGNCYLKFYAGSTTGTVMAALNSDPATDASYSSLDYAIECYLGIWYIYESGSQVLTGAAYTTNTKFEIKYSGTTIEYFVDGISKRIVTTTAGRTFFLDTSFYNTASLVDIVWTQNYLASQVDLRTDPLLTVQNLTNGFAFYGGDGTNTYEVYHNGSKVNNAVVFSNNTKFNIVYSGGSIIYKVNGVVVNTSTLAGTPTLFSKLSFYRATSTINSVKFSDSILKNALSVGLVTSIIESDLSKMIGGFVFKSGSESAYDFVDKGVVVAASGSYSSADTFTVEYLLDTVKWYKNSVLLRTSTVSGGLATWLKAYFYYLNEELTNISGSQRVVLDSNVSGQLTKETSAFYIANAAINSAQIGSLALVGENNFSVKSATVGARMEMDSRAIKIYDASGILRVQLGDLSA
jgi:hypothetical protein